MKLCLGQIVGSIKEEIFWEKSLKVMEGCFDGGVIRLVNNILNYADARNAVIKQAEIEGYTHLLFLDADECMFPEDIEKIKLKLEEHDALMLPRYELGPNPDFYNPTLYPDYQGRAFKLGVGYEYRGPIHEILYKKNEEKCVWENAGFVASDDTHIYHYGRCKAPESIWLRYHNYGRIQQGLEKLDKIPEGTDIDVSPNFKDVVKFEKDKPI